MGRLSLLTRFAVVSLVLVLALGLALSEVVTTLVRHRALESAQQAAVLTASVGIRPLLDGDTIQVPLPEATAHRLDRAIAASYGGEEIARIKIWTADRRLAYAADPHTTGRLPVGTGRPSDELGEALEGEVEVEVLRHSDEPGNGAMLRRYGTLLEVYVPIAGEDGPSEGAEPIGVFELYLPYAPVERAVRADVLRALTVILLGSVLLWLGLFRTMARASRQLRRQTVQAEHDARHDRLTGLPNRTLLLERLDRLVAGDGAAALLLLDLDRFHQVNDTLGHGHGDELLVEVAHRLRQAVLDLSADGLVARLGGDEFALLVPGVLGVDRARRLAETVRSVLREPFCLAGISLPIEASVGVVLVDAASAATAHDAALGAEPLLREADVAMYLAKSGHTGVAVYDPADDHHTRQQLQLLDELRVAIDGDQLVLHYQPKVDLTTGTVVGVEALVRWQHPERGLLPPIEFLPTAEVTGLIDPLTDVVLGQALDQVSQWRTAGHGLQVAVNVSARTLRDDAFPDRVLAALSVRRLPAGCLVLEITETSIMEDPAQSLAALQRLHDAGVYLAVDDFGTGYSSLAYLKTLPVDELKIDRSFVATIRTDARDRHIVASTVSLGRALGLDVVAEGIEDEETAELLVNLGCRGGQGYALGRPVPATDVVLSRRPAGTSQASGAGDAPLFLHPSG